MRVQYFLSLRSYQANFEIRINDVLIESDYKNQNMSYAVPVNHWLRQGRNLISFRLLPHDGDTALRLNARLELCIQRGVEPPGGGEMDPEDFFELNTRDITGQFDEQVPAYAHTGFFTIAESLELPWEKGEPNALDEASVQAVSRVYRQLHRLMVEKDAAGFVAATREKSASCAAALNWDLEEDTRFSLRHFAELFSKPGYEVWPLSKQQLIPSVEGFGRLLSLRNEKRQPPLLLYNREEGSCIFIDVKLYRPEGSSELVVIR